LAMLEPDRSQEGGLRQIDVERLITKQRFEQFDLSTALEELTCAAFEHAPDDKEVRQALFTTEPVEWNRLPQFQDVTIRLIAEKGILRGGQLYLEGEAARGSIALPPPSKGCSHHLFFSPYNEGAAELAEELLLSNVFSGKSAVLSYTTDVGKLKACDHMLVLLDERTWTSGENTAQLVEDVHCAMRLGVHMICAHESPSLVGPSRHECEFDLMFNHGWTPAHLTRRPTNLYSEVELTLKGLEWRKPGLVAVAATLAASTGERQPIDFEVPRLYKPKAGPNPWAAKDVKAGIRPLLEDRSDVKRGSLLVEASGGKLASRATGKSGSRRQRCCSQSDLSERSHLAEDKPAASKAVVSKRKRISRMIEAPPSMRTARKEGRSTTRDNSASLPSNRRATHILSGEEAHVVGRRKSHKVDDFASERDVSAPPSFRSSRGSSGSADPGRASAGAHAPPERTQSNSRQQCAAAIEVQRAVRGSLVRRRSAGDANIVDAIEPARLPAPEHVRVPGMQSSSDTNLAADAVEHGTRSDLLGRARGDSLIEESSVVFSAMLPSPATSVASTDNGPATSSSSEANSPRLDA